MGGQFLRAPPNDHECFGKRKLTATRQEYSLPPQEPASSKIYIFPEKCVFLVVQSYSFNFKLHSKHDLHKIAMN